MAMIERNIQIKEGLNWVLADIGEQHLIITSDDNHKMKLIVDLSQHFKAATEVLSGQQYVSSSLILSVLTKMKENLEITSQDKSKMIRDVKHLMSDILADRY